MAGQSQSSLWDTHQATDHTKMSGLRTIDGCALVESCTSRFFKNQKGPMSLAKVTYNSALLESSTEPRGNKCYEHNHLIMITDFPGSRKIGQIKWTYSDGLTCMCLRLQLSGTKNC